MKLMVVDDETATRNGILKYVHWTELGIEQIKAAGSALEALRISSVWEPDIVISDIRMPDMDGVTLCRKLKEMLPACCLIFISGYADKENLIAAISLSAVSFVEKPFSIEELEAAIQKAVDHCFASHETAYLKSSLRWNMPVIEEYVVKGLVREEITDELLDNCRFLEFPLDQKTCFQVLLFEAREAIKVRAEFLGTILPYFEERQERTLKYFRSERELVMILFSPEKGCFIKESIQNTIMEVIERLNREGIPLFCAAGSVVRGYEQIAASFGKAEQMKEELFFTGYGSASFYRKNGGERTTSGQLMKLSEIEEAIRRYDVPGICKWEERLYRTIRRGSVCSVSEIRKVYFQLLYAVECAALKLLHQEVVRTGDEIWCTACAARTLEELHSCFIEAAEKKLAPSHEREGLSDTVFQVICQIKKDYSREDLDITTLADSVYLTPTYLSNLFKKETGFTIGQYITLVRIKAAKELLGDKSLKLYQVAEQCGYSDQNYFAKIFKRQEGINPSDFRKTRM